MAQPVSPNPDKMANLAFPAFLIGSEETIEILPPVEHDSKLLFQVFCNGTPIAFARLQKLQSDENSGNRVVQLFEAQRCPTYRLKLIQVSQNYRNQGIGSILLHEIVHYCRNHNIKRLIGEMLGGDLPALQRWYLAKGFTVDDSNNIELRIDQAQSAL
jgi:GNAT superfamily N-acetyltransferase